VTDVSACTWASFIVAMLRSGACKFENKFKRHSEFERNNKAAYEYVSRLHGWHIVAVCLDR
jgi:hypothetical protein